jgi:hypothetical protein
LLHEQDRGAFDQLLEFVKFKLAPIKEPYPAMAIARKMNPVVT